MQKQQSDQDSPQSSQEQNQQQIKQKGGQEAMSKRQRKKILKKQKWQKEKLIKRQQKRLKDKEKKKLKALASQQQKQQHQHFQKKQQAVVMKRRKDDYLQKMKEGVTVIIDLQFYDLMTEKQQGSLIKQLGYCHSVNRSNEKCFNYILTSATNSRQTIFSQRYNADKWGISMNELSLLQIYPKEKIIYLTGDAQQQIQQFDHNFVYVIGGIVDHNRLKKITYNFAIQNGIQAKRLPMKNVQLKASVHLAVNHVWEWMLKRYNGLGWDQALKSVLPQRKLQNYKEEV